MPRATLSLEFVTPCFLGGSDNHSLAEWRAPSVRGQLRWWYRALAGAQKDGDLDKVRAGETALFGSTERTSPLRVRASGQPAVVAAGGPCEYGRPLGAAELAREWLGPSASDEALRQQVEDRLRLERNGKIIRSNPVHYLGYGCITYDKGSALFTHARIEPGGQADITLMWPGLQALAQEFKLLEASLWAWLNLGGIGAKSRRGFGSLRCLRAAGNPDGGPNYAPANVAAFKAEAQRWLEPLHKGNGLPEWSHFSAKTRILIATTGSRAQLDRTGKTAGTSRPGWDTVLECAGSWFIGFRRRYGISRDERAQLRERDYEWAAPNGHKHEQGIPDRGGFGLPLPFDKRIVTWRRAAQGGSEPSRAELDADNRRASPLLLHVARLGDEWFPVFTYIPSRLIPAGAKLAFKSKAVERDVAEQQQVVTRFLDDLAAKKLVEDVL